ncbi:MAG: EamA family transporter [Candidatus Dormibacteria bacterium]
MFQRHGVSPEWLVSVRMLGSAAILLLVLRPRLSLHDLPRLAVFGILGLALVQYTYFAAISLMGVALATFVQYLSLPMLATWAAIAGRQRPRLPTWIAVALAVTGTSVLVLASPRASAGLRVSPVGLAVGNLSAVAVVFYTLYSVGIARDMGALRGNAWGFLFGGAAIALVAPPWAVHATSNLAEVAGLTAFVVLVGTLAAYSLYVASLKLISPTEAGTAVSIEPVSAGVASALFLGAPLTPMQSLGGALITVAVVTLRIRAEKASLALEPGLPPGV